MQPIIKTDDLTLKDVVVDDDYIIGVDLAEADPTKATFKAKAISVRGKDVISLNTIADMKTREGSYDGQGAILNGFNVKGDSGGGEFYWNSSYVHVSTDIEGLQVYVTGVTVGAWIRVDLSEIYASWVGMGILLDDTTLFEDLCNNHNNIIYNVTATIKDATITNSSLKIGGDKNNILSIDILKFTGDKIVLKDLKIKVTDASVLASEYSVTNGCLGGLVFQGSNCVVDDCEIYRDNYEYSSGYQSTRLVYFGMTVDMGDFVSQAQTPTGHNNEIRNSSLHDSKDGVDFAGRKNKVLNCRLNNLSNPVRFNASCRDVVANDNIIVGNIDNYYSGADGILCSRTVIGFTATNNEISNNGEHGVYFQGQKAEITNNRVFGNFHNGLKFGSYDDFSYVYAGETLDTWVPGSAGVPGFQEVVGADGFGLKDVVIANNNIYDNGESLSTAYGVYVQPSSKNFKIENNILENNSIYWVYFQTTSRLEDHIDVSITNNRVYGSFAGTNSYIECGCHSNAHIKDNYVEGKIFTYAPNSTVPPRLSQTQINSRIENNECEFIDPTRTTELKVTGNTMAYLISTSSFSRLFLNSNTITESLQIDPRNIREMKNNEIEILTDAQLIYSASSPYSFPLKTIGNTFKGDSYTGSYFISASFNADIPENGIFSDNKIECALCQRPLYVEGEYCVISDNVIVGKPAFDIALDNHGDNMIISNNIVRYGQIQNRNDSASIVTGNKTLGIVDTGTTNIIANNG